MILYNKIPNELKLESDYQEFRRKLKSQLIEDFYRSIVELVDDGMFPTSDPDVKHLSIMKKKWKYRGEGNANLVLALPEERVILRLHKTRRDTPITKALEVEEMNRVCREAFFCETVMVPLLGKAYIQPPVAARVQHSEIHHLDELLLPQRPKFRHHKGIAFGYVNIYPDYALLPEHLTQTVPVTPALPPTLRGPAVVCSSRGKCTRLRHVSHTQDHSLDDISRVSTTVINILHQKCIDKSCILSNPGLLSSELCQMPSVNRKGSKNCQHSPHLVSSTAEPTFCVEIKPKQGWIPRSQLHHPKCTFCLNQYLKLSNGAISRISQYCPLDLFSGDKKRMKNAIKALLRTPQNNLKIFKDGYLVYSDDSSQDPVRILQQWLEPSTSDSPIESQRLIDSFCSLVQHTLTTDLLGQVTYPPLEDQFVPLICSPHHTSRIEGSLMERLQPCDLSFQPLPSNCILDRILCMQKLQQYDTDTVHRMLWQYKGCDDYDYVAKLCDPDTHQLCMDPVQRYLLATTAKDCSILISFQRLRNKGPVPLQHIAVDPSSGVQFVFNIGVSDLDPKPLSCIEKHRKRDADIHYACSQPMPNHH